jgi:hypothetical protein
MKYNIILGEVLATNTSLMRGKEFGKKINVLRQIITCRFSSKRMYDAAKRPEKSRHLFPSIYNVTAPWSSIQVQSKKENQRK